MNNPLIQSGVARELALMESNKRFRQSAIRRHIHNGYDSNVALEHTRVFSGLVPDDGVTTGASTNGFQYLPDGWLTLFNGTNYFVVHNLGTPFYSVLITSDGPESGPVFVATDTHPDYFQVATYNGAGTIVPTTFRFMLVQINNKAATFPSYVANNPIQS